MSVIYAVAVTILGIVNLLCAVICVLVPTHELSVGSKALGVVLFSGNVVACAATITRLVG